MSIDMAKYKVAIYIRLSREDDKTDEEGKYHKRDSESVKNQRNILQKYIEQNKLNLVNEYVDDGYSGSNFDRPSFKKMINDIEKGLINMVIVKDLSRLGRNNIETSEYVDRYFPIHRVRFIALLDDVDTELDTMGNEMASFKIVINEYYNRITSKNIRTTVKNKKTDGLFLGWKAPYGYKKSSEDKYKLEIDEKAAKVVRRIFELAKAGNGPNKIANILTQDKIPTPSNYANLNRGLRSTAYNLWCSRTIDEMLSNETYIGNLTQGRRKKIYGLKMEIRTSKTDWIIVENTHAPIVDKTTFEQVQKIRSKNLKSGSKIHNYLFKHFLRCKECGHAIGITTRTNRRQSYTSCTYYQKYSKLKLCTPHTMNYGKLEAEIISKIRQLCENYVDRNSFKSIIEDEEKNNNEYEKLKVQVSSLEKELDNYDNYFDDIYLDLKKKKINEEQYERTKSKLEVEQKYKKERLDKLNERLSNTSNHTAEEKQILKFINEYISFKKPSKELLALLINRIEIDENKKIDIYFNFKI
ncbi:MAG: recombinase family protein [Bacilli bacterium]|nr:recombinase family protein [Bacilli bacterium]